MKVKEKTVCEKCSNLNIWTTMGAKSIEKTRRWKANGLNFWKSYTSLCLLRLRVSVHPLIGGSFSCLAVSMIIPGGSHTLGSNYCMVLALAKLSYSTS